MDTRVSDSKVNIDPDNDLSVAFAKLKEKEASVERQVQVCNSERSKCWIELSDSEIAIDRLAIGYEKVYHGVGRLYLLKDRQSVSEIHERDRSQFQTCIKKLDENIKRIHDDFESSKDAVRRILDLTKAKAK
ncbi:hypothetical protein ACOME3_008981 [Neoechinorhynchus agilis]